jgi:hypothetical protein
MSLLARQKSRVLIARAFAGDSEFPVREYNNGSFSRLSGSAPAGVFAGSAGLSTLFGTSGRSSCLDGARADAATAIDLQRHGILAARSPGRVPALGDRHRPGFPPARRASPPCRRTTSPPVSQSYGTTGLRSQFDASADLIVLNPLFHGSNGAHRPR